MTDNHSSTLAMRLREVFIDGKWIANTNYKEQIEGLDWRIAVQSVHNLNSVAKLTFHINYYLEGLIKVLQGGPLEISDKYSFNLPEIQSQGPWDKLVGDFIMNAELFSNLVGQLKDEQLSGPFVKPEYGTMLRNIEGVLEHSYYHLGQLVLIKKLVES